MPTPSTHKHGLSVVKVTVMLLELTRVATTLAMIGPVKSVELGPGRTGVGNDPASVERLGAMRTAGRNSDADLADFEMPEPMLKNHLADRPARACVCLDLGHLLLGHCRVGIVIESDRDAVTGQVAHRAEKKYDSAAIVTANLFRHGMVINDFARETYHLLYLTRRSPVAIARLLHQPESASNHRRIRR